MTLPDGSGTTKGTTLEKNWYCHLAAPVAKTTTIWATSSSRKLLSDRKDVLDHLKPQKLFVSTTKVAFIQASNIFTVFFIDQLKAESKQETLVDSGKLTPAEANKQNQEWEAREWSKRWSSYPHNFINALLKFHAMTFFMRFYERVFASLLSIETLDKLTMDTHHAALRTKQDLTSNNSHNNNIDSHLEMGKVMFRTCLWGNFVFYLSDWSVYQLLLGWTYYVYVRQKRQRTTKDNICPSYTNDGQKIASTAISRNTYKDGETKEGDVELGGIFWSFGLRSSKLTISRTIAWVSASAGGAVGSMIYPGWGTVLGTQSGDALVGAILD